MSLTGYIVGAKGNTGRGISSIVENNDYTITINLTDGTSYTTEPIPGYTNVAFDANYNLVVTKTDGTTETVSTPLKTYITTAEGYKTDAQTAATNAGNSATAASGSAATATAQATLSRSYAKGDTSSRTGEATDNADYYRQQASTSATSASTSAGTATTQALKSEGYAVGEQNGSAVASDSPYYNNNASYYYDMAKNKAVESNQAKRDSVSASQKSEAYAKGTINGVDVESGSTGYHDNSKYYKEQASTSATNASTSATTATTNALKSEGYAVGKQNGTDVSSGDYYQNNAKYYKEQAESSATSASASASTAQSYACGEAIADTYDATATYAVGDYVMYQGDLYCCNTAITTAEAWTAAHWTQVTVGEEMSSLKDDLFKIETASPSDFGNRAFSASTGGAVSSTKRIGSSDYIDQDIVLVTVEDNYFIEIVCYNKSDSSYAGIWNGSSLATSAYFHSKGVNLHDIPNFENYKFKLCMRTTPDSAEVSTSEATNITLYHSNIIYNKIIENLLADSIPNTEETVSFSGGKVSGSVHKDGNNNTIRTDVVTYSGSTITEVRTGFGKTATIVVNTEDMTKEVTIV